MRKLLSILVALVVTITLVPANASAAIQLPRGAKTATKASRGKKSNTKLPKGMAYKASTKLPEGMKLKIIPVRAKAPIFEKDFKRCLSRAEKLELPAPPRDPLAHCKGGVTVKAGASVVASCKPGYMGGRAKSFIAINMKIKVRAFSQAIASGRAWAAARTEWSYRLKGWVRAEVTCVKPLKEKREAPPSVTPDQPQPYQPPVFTCPDGKIVNSPASCNFNQNNAEQNCKAMGGDYNHNNNLCTIIQIIGNCSNITVINGSGNVIENRQEGNCNIAPPPPPPPDVPKCPDGRPVPRDGDCDRGPWLSVIWPPHIYTNGGNQAIWSEASDPDGDTLSTPNFDIVEGAQYAHISSTVRVDERWDGTPCPAGITCYRSTLWGDAPGWVTFRATVYAGGKSVSVTGRIQVSADEF